MNQSKIFFEFEGDNWFERNKDVLAKSLELDLPLRLMELYQLQPKRVLEVGAANGFRLAEIHSRYGAEVVAVEPSQKAIRDGQVRFPFIRFVRASAHAIPLQDTFDCIIVNFVLHWIDRSHLLQSVGEIDRLLADSGYLLIGDFYPKNLIKTPYHHLPSEDVYTFKQDYAAPFVASGLYQPVAILTADHSSKSLISNVSEDEKIAVSLLQKRLTGYYTKRLFSPQKEGSER